MRSSLLDFFIAIALLVPLISAQDSLKSCLKSAISDSDRLAFPGLFFDLTHVKRYNLYYKIKPAAIAYPESADEVSKVVKCAAQHKVKVQARSGGHSFGDYCLSGKSGALTIDLKYLNQLSYDKKTQTAHLGPGNHLEDVNDFLLEYNRLVPHGDAPQVGVGGHYTIGGLGRISRQFGAATDQIISAQVVLADGRIVTASSQENVDLYFAIRGAGASFGIVTDFHVKTHPAPGSAVAYSYNITLGDAELQADAFKAWQKLISDPKLSWKFSTQFIVFPVGSLINGFFFGTEAEFSSLDLATQIPGLDDPSTEISVRVVDSAIAIGQQISDLGLKLFGGLSTHFYSKSLSFSNKTLMSDKAIDAMFAYLAPSSASSALNALKTPWFVIFDLEGGAINTVPQDSVAYAFRDALYFIQSYAVDVLGIFQKDARAFLDGLNEIILDYAKDKSAYGSYPGYVDPFLENAQSMYWRGNLARLQQVKKKYDPAEVFWNLQSVKAG